MFEDYFEQIEDQLEEAMENQTDPEEDDQLITKLQQLHPDLQRKSRISNM